MVGLSVVTKTLHQSVFWSVNGCYYTTLLSQPAGRCISRGPQSGGGGGGGAEAPNIFTFLKSY